MKKGIIMEIRRDILVLMTPEGEFIRGKRLPDQQYSIGEEIPFFPILNNNSRSKRIARWNWKVSTSFLTAALLLIALFSSVFLQNSRAYAYVSVDINPSVELSLNKEQEVINITPYNQEAENLLKKLNDWKDKDVRKVTQDIILLSEKLGYLKEGQNVLITSSITNRSNANMEKDLMVNLNTFVKDYNTMHNTIIMVKETTPELRERASKQGKTAGTLLKETVKEFQPDNSNPTEEKENEVKLKDKNNKTLSPPSVPPKGDSNEQKGSASNKNEKPVKKPATPQKGYEKEKHDNRPQNVTPANSNSNSSSSNKKDKNGASKETKSWNDNSQNENEEKREGRSSQANYHNEKSKNNNHHEEHKKENNKNHKHD